MSANQPIAIEDDEAVQEPTTVSGTSKIMTLGRYRLVVELASGGMATVFLARAEGPAGFEKLVALKRIHPHLAKEKSFVDMFLDEARIASRIHHPSVCTVFDFGAADESYFIAMEYLVGEPLSRVCKAIATNEEFAKSDRLSTVAAHIIGDACEGLHAAHELRGKDGKSLDVVHRDVSPQNLFISYDGHVKVVDFGIASATDRLHHTATGQIKGKFGYMAPEQAQAKNPDRRADIWSLGVVLWEMLTLKRLFRRPTTAQTLYAVLSDEVPPPSSIRPGIPAELDAIVLRALARDVDQRYQTASELGRDLVKFAAKAGEPVGPADLADWMEKLFPEGKRRKQQLIDSASGEDGTTIDVPIPMVDETSNSSTSAFQPGDIVRRAVAQQRAAAAQSSAVETVPIRDRRLGRIALVAGILLVIASSAGLGWAFGGGSGSSAELASAAPPSNVPAVGVAHAPPQAVNPPAVQTTPPVVPPPVVPTTPRAAVPVPGAAAAAGHTKRVGGRPPRGGSSAAQTPRTGGNSPGTTGTSQTQTQTQTPTPPTHTDPTPPPDPNPPRQRDPVGPSAPATGTLNVLTPGGWANVYDERGRFLGQTPVRATLPVGPHQLSLRPFGQPPAQTVNVVIQATAPSRVVRPLAQ